MTDRESDVFQAQPPRRPDDEPAPEYRKMPPRRPVDQGAGGERPSRPTEGPQPGPAPTPPAPPPNAHYAEAPSGAMWAPRSSTPEPARPPAGEAEERTVGVAAAPRRDPAENGWSPPAPARRAEPRPPSDAEQTSYIGEAPPARPAQESPLEQPGWSEPATRSPREAQRQSNTWAGERPASAPAAGNWSYVEGIRSSELVPTRKVPPGRGWRRALYKSTFGLINLGLSPDERRQADLETKIRSLLRGHYKIGVLGKGGTGKTTVAASVGSIIASLRQDDRVVAVDADTAFGKLGSRIDPRASGSYWELAADQHLHSFTDVRSRVGNNDAGLFVLAGEASTARRRVLDPSIYREATRRLDQHFSISIVDCGSTIDSAVTQEVLRDLDALMVVSSPWVDGASAAGQTMEWLANTGYTALLNRTVVVLNDSDGHVDKRTLNVLVEQFSSRGQVVVVVPFDPHLRPGGVIDVNNEIDRVTRRRFTEIAAAIAEHFETTTDRPRERR
ncbi:MAG: ATPase involved in chromosome partitioning-like protein [Mycobacterium sp.]|nr:ATPase involved in chromosome partitioning-like protein [Mycobacterium sp.]